MTIFQIALVTEPPTEVQLGNMLATDPVSKTFTNFIGSHGKDAAVHAAIAKRIGELKLNLASYRGIPRGNEAYLTLRQKPLSDAMKHCDEISKHLCHLLAYNGLFGQKMRQQYAGMSLTILSVYAACKAKWTQLNNLRRFISDQNMQELAHGWKPLSVQGQELRSITKCHLAESLSGFGIYVHDGTSVFASLFAEWQELMYTADLAEEEGGTLSVPCFPVYLEGQVDVGFGHNEFLSNLKRSVVHYDGSEENSPFYMEVKDGCLIATTMDKDNRVEKRKYTPTTYNTVFIIDARENFYAYPHRIGSHHHSTATAGRAVLGAGKIDAEDGKITGVSDHSGHYQPTPRHMVNAVRVMQKKGILAAGAKVSMFREPFGISVDIEKLLAAADEGFSRENLQRAAGRGNVDFLLAALTDPDWTYVDPTIEPEHVLAMEKTGDMNERRMITDRPRQEIRYTPIVQTRNRARRARALGPLQLLHPAPQAPAPAPRTRRDAVLGRS